MEIIKSTGKEAILRLGKACKRCGHCCSFGSGYVLQDDIKRISKRLKLTKEELAKKYLEETDRFHTKTHKIRIVRQGKQYGRCAFYEPGAGCTIHTIKPFYCRISTCSQFGEAIQDWFSLNFFVNPADPESLRQWNTRLKLRSTIPGGRCDDLLQDKEKLRNILEYQIVR